MSAGAAPGGAPAPRSAAGTWRAIRPILLAIGVPGVLVVAVLAVTDGSNLLHDFRESRRVARDPHARGHVLGLRDTGQDNHGEPLVEVTVEFPLPDGRAVRTRTLERVNALDALRLSTPEEVDVWYDPQNPVDAVLRWRTRAP